MGGDAKPIGANSPRTSHSCTGTMRCAATSVLRLLSESLVTLSVCTLVALVQADRQAVAILCASPAIFFMACAAIEIGFKELPARLFGPLQVALVVATLITCRMCSRPTAPAMAMVGATLAGGLFFQQAWTTVADAVADNRAFDGSFRAWWCSPAAASEGNTRSPRAVY
jgi:hypothetical protein